MTHRRAWLLLWFALLFPSGASAREAFFRWGGDAQGGAPFIFKDAKDPTQTRGFEVDIANALAKRLKTNAIFVQNQWDGLIPGLNNDNYDVALNGIEITPDRQKEVLFSLPYYATAEQLTVRNDTVGIATLTDLRGKKVGTLKASLAERYLKQENDTQKAGIDILTYDDQDTAYEDLSLGRTTAVLMDFPIALYCADPNRLKNVGKPIGFMQYGIAIRKGNAALLSQVNAALTDCIRSGELRQIYQKWGLWNDETRRLFQQQFPDASDAYVGESPAAGEALAQYRASAFKTPTLQERLEKYLFVYLPILLKRGAGMTILLSITAMAVAMLLGIPLALLNLYAPLPFSRLARAYIELFRGTPLLIQLYLIYYGLPRIGLAFPPFVAAVIGLGLNYAAYEAENYRAGLQAVPQDQREAAGIDGMSSWATFRFIILPQALRITIPPVTNDFVSLLKDSSIVSVITMVELTKAFGELAMIHFDFIGLGLLTAFVYFLIGLPFIHFARFVESRLAHS